jgi:hypothetical protein
VGYAGGDEAEARPGVEPVVHQAQLGRVVANEQGGERPQFKMRTAPASILLSD